MKEDKEIKTYIQRVDEIKSALEGLRELVDKKVIVRKVLKTIPSRFNPKVSILEDRSYLSNFSMDELDGILTA